MYEIKFQINEKVKPLEIIHKSLHGIVIGICIDNTGTQYRVRYFWECKSQEVYFYGWELAKID